MCTEKLNRAPPVRSYRAGGQGATKQVQHHTKQRKQPRMRIVRTEENDWPWDPKEFVTKEADGGSDAAQPRHDSQEPKKQD